jgi:hypothetical protein
MTDFARLTGLSPAEEAPRRYLWTDAFAVCNFLELYRQTNDETYKQLALSLVDQVHTILGRHRKDDSRIGWISGLGDDEGKKHPTQGGLRIGKKMKERGPSEPFDEEREWDRDGQYYHYLTKWMHALNCVSRVTGDVAYNRWAIELAKTVHTRFTHVPPFSRQKRMYWKMSIDLSYPLVPSMGQQDPLDGFITYHQLQATAANDPEKAFGPDLKTEIAEMAGICEGKSWVTDDPLGIGGLLCDAYRAVYLAVNKNFKKTDLIELVLEDSLAGLEAYARNVPWKRKADYRLAFRELGFSTGLRAVEKVPGLIEEHKSIFKQYHKCNSIIDELMRYLPLAKTIETFWLEPLNRKNNLWEEHGYINMVMLATSLAPDGFLPV